MSSVFILGAGFCLDANRLANQSGAVSGAYPLACEMAACFGGRYDLSNGVEEAFLAARNQRDRGPGEQLVDLIQTADYFVGSRVATMKMSPYRDLVNKYPRATFLSFNYDCLLEQLLLLAQLWNPRDGFGAPANALVHPVAVDNIAVAPSSSVHVLHLHGSIYLYPVEYETYTEGGRDPLLFRQRGSPEFRFDPDALGHHFLPFERIPPDIHYMLPYERLILPVPDKSEDLAQRALQLVYTSATNAIRIVGAVIAIGYSFAPYDLSSYRPLLQALEQTDGQRLTVVDPNAHLIAERLHSEFPKLTIEPVRTTFSLWIDVQTQQAETAPSNEEL
ncbi:MAG: hypothetical protein Q8S00_16230 [Deltaproteobacteria bacterium]|nr:hypothetical protein [Deltaproteobacteria bacterium]